MIIQKFVKENDRLVLKWFEKYPDYPVMSKKMLQKGYSKIVENYNRKKKSGKCLQKDRKTYIHINGKGEKVDSPILN